MVRYTIYKMPSTKLYGLSAAENGKMMHFVEVHCRQQQEEEDGRTDDDQPHQHHRIQSLRLVSLLLPPAACLLAWPFRRRLLASLALVSQRICPSHQQPMAVNA